MPGYNDVLHTLLPYTVFQRKTKNEFYPIEHRNDRLLVDTPELILTIRSLFFI